MKSLVLVFLFTCSTCLAIVTGKALPDDGSTQNTGFAPSKLRNMSAGSLYDKVLEQLSTGSQKIAEAILDSACQQYPKDQRLLFANAVCAKSRWSHHAIAMMQDVVQMDAGSAEGQAANAMLRLESGANVTNSFTDLSILVDKNPQQLFMLWLLAVECRQHFRKTGDCAYSPKGAECYRKLLSKWTVGPVLVHHTFANLLSEELDRHEEALEHRRLAFQMEPASWTYEGLGNTLVMLRRYEEATAAFEQCIKMEPEDAHYWVDWALCLRDQKKYEESAAKCEVAAKLNPREPMVWTTWGGALVALNRMEEAIAKYEQHMRYNPGDDKTRRRLENVRSTMQSKRENNQKRYEGLNKATPESIREMDAYVGNIATSLFTTNNAVLGEICSRGATNKTTNPTEALLFRAAPSRGHGCGVVT